MNFSATGAGALNQIIDTIRIDDGDISSITNSNEPTLEDVFLIVTGKEIRDHTNEKSSMLQHGNNQQERVR